MATRKPAARKLTVYKAATAELVAFETKYETIVIDCTTPTGMKSAKDCRKEIRDARSNLEDLRKETKAPVLAKGKQIDAEAKEIISRLDTLFNKFDSEIKAIENKKEIAAKKATAEALAKEKSLEEREQAIIAKEIELGLREPDEATRDGSSEGSSDTCRATSISGVVETTTVAVASTICEPHIKAAAERLHALKAIRSLIEPTDAQPCGAIDEAIAQQHDEVLAEVWEIVDAYQ